MKKHLLCMIALVLAALFALPVCAYDFSQWRKIEYPFEVTPDMPMYGIEIGAELYYNINDDGKSVTVTNGPMTYSWSYTLIIPSSVTYEGKTYTVTNIGYKAFYEAKIAGIEIPGSVVAIGEQAFAESKLTSCKFNVGLKTIGQNAFYAAPLQKVYLPEGLERIERCGFAGRYQGYSPEGTITSLSLPSTLRFIGEYAFNSQNELKSVSVPEGITEIQPNTFSGCLSLSSLTLPSTLTKIGNYAFQGCKLSKFQLPSSVTEIGDYAFSAAGTGYNPTYHYMTEKEIVIPNSVTKLGDGVFYGCRATERIVFPNSLTAIPASTCSYCELLTTVEIPEGYTSVGSSAFSDCKMLSHIKLPESIETIGGGCFFRSGLAGFSFPKRMTILEGTLFSECTNLASIEIPESIVLCNGDMQFFGCKSLKNVVIKNLKDIPHAMFMDCTALETVDLCGKAQTIGGEVFYRCSNLVEVKGIEEVISINYRAFSACTSLESIALPHTLTTLGSANTQTLIFANSTALKKITIPSSVKSMGYQNFHWCKSLLEVHVQSAIPLWANGTCFSPDNTTTLYVPRGSREAYEASSCWNNAKEIIEEDPADDIIYRISAVYQPNFGGNLRYNGKNVSNIDLQRGSEAILTVVPNNGYYLKSLTIDDEDAMDMVADDGTITISSLERNHVFVATFQRKPVEVTVSYGLGGSVVVPVEYGKTFEYQVKPADGWSIKSVRFNGTDVMDKMQDGCYVSEALYQDCTLDVKLKNDAGVVSKYAADVDGDGTVTMADANAVVNIYVGQQ